VATSDILESNLKKGRKLIFSGEVRLFNSQREIHHPDVEMMDEDIEKILQKHGMTLYKGIDIYKGEDGWEISIWFDSLGYAGEPPSNAQKIVDAISEYFVEKGFRIFHRITKDKKLIALVETGILAYNYETKKTAPVPTAFLKCLASR
jgi:hypothetical protein